MQLQPHANGDDGGRREVHAIWIGTKMHTCDDDDDQFSILLGDLLVYVFLKWEKHRRIIHLVNRTIIIAIVG